MESDAAGRAVGTRRMAERVPPQAFLLVSALFHYLGPSFAVLLFGRLAPLGVAWLRVASAAGVFAVLMRPWRFFRTLPASQRVVVLALGVVLAAMNCCFYLAIARLPLGTVGAIEFLGPIALAAAGMRMVRNFLALGVAAIGVFVLTDIRIAGEPAAYAFAFANCALFVLYVVLGHRIAVEGSGIQRLGAAMLIAAIAALPVGAVDAAPAFVDPILLMAGIGVGVSSSVIPYVCDQLAMARLPRASFALMLSLLPATASVVGLLMLRQVPEAIEVLGIALVAAGVALHRPVS